MAPGSVILDAVERWRILRAQVALLLHITPEAVDRMPAQDIEDVVAIHNVMERLRLRQPKKRQGR